MLEETPSDLPPAWFWDAGLGLLPDAPFAGRPCYLFGDGRPALVARLAERLPDVHPLLLDSSADRLYAERGLLQPLSVGGFLRDAGRPGWARGLPENPCLVVASFRISTFPEERRSAFLAEVRQVLPMDGFFFWVDVFLPETLERLACHDTALARLIPGWSAARRREDHPEACLMVRAVEELSAAGFANPEAVAVFGQLALLAAG
jgi:hypothetical protein